MPLLINLRHLEEKSLVLKGEMTPQELELEFQDELVHLPQPLHYDLVVEKFERSVLAQGKLRLVLQCECSRCLKPFPYALSLGDWIAHLPLEGEESVRISNDCVDLTPYLREDILLALPQHPLCGPECGGLAGLRKISEPEPHGLKQSIATPSAWVELNKLKFEK